MHRDEIEPASTQWDAHKPASPAGPPIVPWRTAVFPLLILVLLPELLWTVGGLLLFFRAALDPGTVGWWLLIFSCLQIVVVPGSFLAAARRFGLETPTARRWGRWHIFCLAVSFVNLLAGLLLCAGVVSRW